MHLLELIINFYFLHAQMMADNKQILEAAQFCESKDRKELAADYYHQLGPDYTERVSVTLLFFFMPLLFFFL